MFTSYAAVFELRSETERDKVVDYGFATDNAIVTLFNVRVVAFVALTQQGVHVLKADSYEPVENLKGRFDSIITFLKEITAR